MREHFELQDSLLAGLPDDEQGEMRSSLERARAAQKHQVEHPPSRRQRDADGVLRWPDGTTADREGPASS